MSKSQYKQPIKRHVKKGDVVKVLAGEDKGKQGKVLFVEPGKHRAIVEGVNIVHKHIRPNATYPNGTIEKKEGPVHLSNLMVIDPKTNEPTRVGRKEVDGKLKRYSKNSGEVID
jgi:large subunit ribosomal protein L24